MNIINKDITTVSGPAIIIHGVNCHDAMGSGVAKAIYTKWPQVKSNYHEFGSMILGDIQPVQVDKDLWVVNCFTQRAFGTDNQKYAVPMFIEACLKKTMNLAMALAIKTVYSPRIGCGLGGLDWDGEVKEIYEHISEVYYLFDITICDFN